MWEWEEWEIYAIVAHSLQAQLLMIGFGNMGSGYYGVLSKSLASRTSVTKFPVLSVWPSSAQTYTSVECIYYTTDAESILASCGVLASKVFSCATTLAQAYRVLCTAYLYASKDTFLLLQVRVQEIKWIRDGRLSEPPHLVSAIFSNFDSCSILSSPRPGHCPTFILLRS